MKIGILGAGAMGRTVIDHLQHCPAVTKIAGYDPNPESRQTTEEKTGVACTACLPEILDDADVKLVFITASNGAHKDLALAAMRAGKAVMCEKPMATSIEDAIEMVEEAERLGAFLQIGFELRYSLLYKKVKDWINEGKLGEVRNIQCNYLSGEYWGPNSWRVKLGKAGSMFGEKLCHYVDLQRWWIGSEVSEVYSMASNNIVSYYEVRDNYHTSCQFENGAVSHLTFMMPFASTSVADPLTDMLEQQKDDGNELRYMVMGTKGGVETNVFRRHLKRWEFTEENGKFISKLVETLHWTAEEDHRYIHNTGDQSHDIVHRVLTGQKPATSPRDALQTMLICEAADLSIDRKAAIRIEELTTQCA